MSCFVICPACRHKFESSETFAWAADSNGDLTVGTIFCPECKATTHGPLAHWDFDDFIELLKEDR